MVSMGRQGACKHVPGSVLAGKWLQSLALGQLSIQPCCAESRRQEWYGRAAAGQKYATPQ